jgi:hypothetical protein
MVPIESEEVFVKTVVTPLFEMLKETAEVEIFKWDKIIAKVFQLIKVLHQVVNSSLRKGVRSMEPMNRSSRGGNNGILNS